MLIYKGANLSKRCPNLYYCNLFLSTMIDYSKEEECDRMEGGGVKQRRRRKGVEEAAKKNKRRKEERDRGETRVDSHRRLWRFS